MFLPTMFEIPLTTTTLDEEEVEAAVRVLRSKWLTMGEEVAAFEGEFAVAMGSRHAVAVSNGTTALEIAYEVAGFGPDDEVILPSITFVACLNGLRRLGVVAVLADVASEDDLTINVQDVARKITPRTRGIVSMPHAGFCPAMAELEALAHDRGLVLIEDACHAPLAELDGRKIGTFGRAATWSFFGNKNMTTGEGGMITTDDEGFAARCRLIRSHGITRTTWDRARGHSHDYDVACVGTNARMDEIRAAIGRVQLRKLPGATQDRARVAGVIRRLMEDARIPGLGVPYSRPRGTSAHHLFCVLLPVGADRRAVMTAMKEVGVQTSIHYPPLHRFGSTAPFFQTTGRAVDLPVTEAVEARILTLPLGPAMSEAECGRVVEALAEGLRNRVR